MRVVNTKILLVDDEPLTRDELGGLLQDEGYEVHTAADGDQGLKLFRHEHPDLVITDVRMPRRDGLSLVCAIRREDPYVPIAVITGHGTEAMVIEALRMGINDFIKKPVRVKDLTAALQRLEAARRPLEQKHAEMPSAVKLVAHSWTYELQNDLEAIPFFVDTMLKHCASGIDRVDLLELSLCLRELILNSVEHGNLGLSYEEKTQALEAGTFDELLEERAQREDLRDRRVTVKVSRQDNRLMFDIIDQGEGFDWRALPDPTDPPNLLSIHGRGVLLARLSVDSLRYNEKGNQVTIEKKFQGRGNAGD
jgi:YesN/AraC family two-component response regulator